MKSKEYWERRAAERMVNYQADAERTANEIGEAYYQSQEYIKSEIDKVFRGFQKGFSLSEEEALDILDPSSNKTAMTVLRDAAMKIADPVEREKALAALSSPAYQYRINRLDAINSNIAATCNSLYRTELKADSSFLSSEIVKAYQNTIFDVQKGTGVSGAFDIIPQSKIDAIMSRNWSGTHYSDRIWNNTNKLAGELKSDLMAGFLTGKSEQQMSAEIAERYQTSFFNARRLVRTECTYVTGQAELHSYTEMGVEEYEFSAVLDGDTSKICRSLNGKKFKVSQAKPGVNYPPMHPFCRSVANAVLPSEEELDDMWGDTADAIGADVDFDEWVKNLEKTPDGKWKYHKNDRQNSYSMAARSNDWTGALPQSHTKEEIAEIVNYANTHGVKIYNANSFDGDIELLKGQIDAISDIKRDFSVDRDITITFGAMPDDDLAITKKHTITFNRKALRDKAITEANITSGNIFSAGNHKGISYHEMGHFLAETYGEKGIDILQKAYYNIYKAELPLNKIADVLTSEISDYSASIQLKRHGIAYKEIIPEILSKEYTNSSPLSAEFIRLLKGAYGI